MQSDQLVKTYASNYPKSAPDPAQRLVPEQIPGLDLGIHSSIKHIHLNLPKNTLCNSGDRPAYSLKSLLCGQL